MTAWENRNGRMRIRRHGLFTSILMGASDSEVKLKGTGRMESLVRALGSR